jgi:Holliday junction DNA helicase RuvA
MIAYLRGRIKYLCSNWLILEVNNVGYKIFTNQKSEIRNTKQIENSNNKNPKRLKNSNLENSKIVSNFDIRASDLVKEFYIYNHIREDRNELYGFEAIKELQFFEVLISVNGVGPKMAMNILSHAKLEQLEKAIASNDTTLLTSVGGVGKKIATKIIIDLKNKIGQIGENDLDEIMEGGSELIDAAIALGYKKSEITPYISKMPHNLSNTGEKIKWLLKEMKK